MFIDNLPYIIIGALLGACLGSYLGCALWRIPRHISLLGSSQCPHCGKPVPGYLNIPVFAFIGLRGKTHCCHQRLPRLYLVTEVGTVIVGAILGGIIQSYVMAAIIAAVIIIVPFIVSIITRRRYRKAHPEAFAPAATQPVIDTDAAAVETIPTPSADDLVAS